MAEMAGGAHARPRFLPTSHCKRLCWFCQCKIAQRQFCSNHSFKKKICSNHGCKFSTRCSEMKHIQIVQTYTLAFTLCNTSSVRPAIQVLIMNIACHQHSSGIRRIAFYNFSQHFLYFSCQFIFVNAFLLARPESGKQPEPHPLDTSFSPNFAHKLYKISFLNLYSYVPN